MTIKRKVILITGILVVISALVAIGATKIRNNKNKDDSDQKKEAVRRGEFIVKIRESGNLESLVSVEVRSNVEGEIEGLYVKEGDVVEKGQKLLKIDDQQIGEQKQQAEANLSVREAQLEQAKLRIYLTEKEQTSAITQTRNAVEVAEASLEVWHATTIQRTTEAETQVATTQNALEQDRIAWRQAKIALQQAQLLLEQYQAAEESARIARETADAELERNKELFAKKLIARKLLEETETRCAHDVSQYETAQKNVQSQLKAVESQKESIEARKRAIDTTQTTVRFQEQNLNLIKKAQEAQQKQRLAELESAKTRLQQILQTTDEEQEMTRHSETSARAGLLEASSTLKAQAERFKWTTVHAPMSGTVTTLAVEEGEIVTSGRSAFSRGGPAILKIADLTRMVVKTRINEVEIAKIKIDQKVEIRVDAYRDSIFEGRVSEIAPSAYSPQQGGQQGDGTITFEVIIEVLGSPPELLPGMSADVDIIVMQRNDVLQLPIDAVIDSEVLTVKGDVPTQDLGRFNSEQEVEVENLIGKKFPGKVGKIWPAKTRSNVEILLDGTPRGLRTGPTAVHVLFSDTDRIEGIEAEIESEQKYFVLLDKEAPQEDTRKKKKTKEKKEKEKGIRTRIEVGERNESHFEIISGLLEGDRVFVPSMQQLTRKERN